MNFKKIIFSLFLLSVTLFAIAQDTPPEGPPDAEIPLDGGIGFLIASGVVLGSRMWLKNKKAR